jgi:hypothetical protein
VTLPLKLEKTAELVDGQQDQADAVAAAKRLDELLASVSAERKILTSAAHPTGH